MIALFMSIFTVDWLKYYITVSRILFSLMPIFVSKLQIFRLNIFFRGRQGTLCAMKMEIPRIWRKKDRLRFFYKVGSFKRPQMSSLKPSNPSTWLPSSSKWALGGMKSRLILLIFIFIVIRHFVYTKKIIIWLRSCIEIVKNNVFYKLKTK